MKSIALKLWSGMMILVLVVLLLLWLFQIVFLDSFYTGLKLSKVKNEGLSIARDMEKVDRTDLQDRIEKLAYNNNAGITLLDTNGNIEYTTGSGTQMPMMFNNLINQALNSVLDGKVVTTTFTHPHFGTRIVLIGIPVKISGLIKGVLFINMPMAPVKDTTAILKNQLVYITIILLFAALVLSYLLSKNFTKPILNITKAATEMASGNFSVRIASKSGDEIGRLANTINDMGEELSKTEQLRKDLIANVSHELRTPLSLIRGYAETIRDISGSNVEKREKQLGIIIEESERLGKLVDDILNLSQIQSGYFSLNIGKFSLSKTIESVIQRYDIISEQTGVRIIIQNLEEAIVAR